MVQTPCPGPTAGVSNMRGRPYCFERNMVPNTWKLSNKYTCGLSCRDPSALGGPSLTNHTCAAAEESPLTGVPDNEESEATNHHLHNKG